MTAARGAELAVIADAAPYPSPGPARRDAETQAEPAEDSCADRELLARGVALRAHVCVLDADAAAVEGGGVPRLLAELDELRRLEPVLADDEMPLRLRLGGAD